MTTGTNNSSTLIVGFGHKARQGKDLAVNHLVETYEDRYDVRRYAFADELKGEIFDALLDLRHQYWNTTNDYLKLPHPVGETVPMFPTLAEKVKWVDEHKADPLLARHLQLYGTEFRRKQDSFYWVSALRSRIAREHPQIALIADMRFKNEFYFVCSSKGYTVKVTRHGFQLSDGRDPKHLGEVDLDGIKFHFEIDVLDGEVDQLKKDAVTVMDMILAHYQPNPPEFENAAAVLQGV